MFKNNVIITAFVAFGLLYSSCDILARDENKSCFSCHKPEKEKRTCAPTPISHATTITKSGSYCLTRDIVGTVTIAADDVCLDLNCHEIDADGAPYAIVIQDVKDVTVFNGSVSGSSVAGIFVDPSVSVELFDLFMHDHVLDAIHVEDSQDIFVHDVNFVGDNGGERALNFIACHNITVNRCNASGFLSTIGAVVELIDCHCGSMQDVDVCGNTKTATADVFFFDPGSAFVAAAFSDGISFNRVKVNNNTFNNTVVLDPNVNFRTASAIQFSFSTGCSLTDCETSNNSDIAGSLANVDTEDYMLCLIICDSCTVTNHKSNNNRCEPEAIVYFMGIAVFDSTSVVLDGCQANSNFVAEMLVAPFFALYRPIWVAPYFTTLSSDHVIRNSQANFNSAANGGAGRTGSQLAALSGIVFESSGVVDHCQANNNSIETADSLQVANGIFLENFSGASTLNDARLLNSSADNNSGGEFSFGILLFPHKNRTFIESCSASSNGGYGLLVGFPGFPPSATQDYVIQNCVFNNNGHAMHDAAGIAVLPGWLTSNMFIKDCQINGTFSGGGTAAGINIPDASNLVIEDTNVFDTVATNTTTPMAGHGIVLTNNTDSKIIRCQLHRNQNAGVELLGTNSNIAIIESIAIDNEVGFEFNASSTASCCLVQDSRAIDNSVAGFVYGPSELNAVFIGNEAQCNGTSTADNYDINGGTISLQELSLSTGVLTNVAPTNAALGARFTNISVVS